MSEIAEVFSEANRISKSKRAYNRKQAPKILAEHNIEYESKNNGAHLILFGHRYAIDFWPGTGKWQCREEENAYGRGIFEMIDYIRGLPE